MDTPQGFARPVESTQSVEAPMEVRIYMLPFDGEGSAAELARLRLCSHQVEAPLGARVPVVINKAAEVRRWEAAAYLVVLQGGEVKRVGRLSSFLDGLSKLPEEEGSHEVVVVVEEEEEEEADDDEESEEEGESEEEAGEEEEEEEEEDGEAEEEGDDDDDEAWESEEEEARESELESESESLSEGEEEEKGEEGEQADKDYCSIKLRICPRLSRMMLVLFVGGNWRLTRGQQINWLQENDEVELLKLIGLGTEKCQNGNPYAKTIKEKRSDEVVCEETSEDGKKQADVDAFMCSEERRKLKEEGTSQQIEKAEEIAKAQLTAAVTKEKASHIEQIAEANLNIWLEFEGTVLNEKLMCSQFNASMSDFRFLKIIGKGAAGKVYQCVHRNDPIGEVQYALKKMDISDDFDDIDAINGEEPREVKILSYLEDDFVVSFYQAWAADGAYKSDLSSDGEANSDGEAYSDEHHYTMNCGVLEPRYVVIQMEFCQRTLKDDLPHEDREINIEESWNIFEEITRGVQCMHRTGIIHRDLKPDNIFVGTNGLIKIGDMGHACWAKVDEWIRTPNRGTSLYNSPEMDTGHNVTIKADIYSLGVVFMELFHSFPTYLGKVKAVSDIKNMQPPTDWKGDTEFLMQLMALCPSERPSTQEILDYIDQRRKTNDSQ